MGCRLDDPVVVDDDDGTVFCEGALVALSVGSSPFGDGDAALGVRFSGTKEGDSPTPDVLIEALRVARLSERAVNVLLDWPDAKSGVGVSTGGVDFRIGRLGTAGAFISPGACASCACGSTGCCGCCCDCRLFLFRLNKRLKAFMVVFALCFFWTRNEPII